MVAFGCRITEDSNDLPGYTLPAPVVLSSPGMMSYHMLSYLALGNWQLQMVRHTNTGRARKVENEGNYSKAANNK